MTAAQPIRATPLRRTLIIACGALARELVALIKHCGWRDVEIACLPAILHNRPREIPTAVRRKIRARRAEFERVLCLYGDCGTGGELDRVLAEEGVERIEGPHCYAFFAGVADFDAMMRDEPGTLFLTDYLARHFERLIWRGLGLDRHPELRTDYFQHYRRVVYLEQIPDPATAARARDAARRLGLAFETRATGLKGLGDFLADKVA